MAFGVVYDACVLYPAHLRDLLLRIAKAELVHAHWTEAILDECFASLQRDRPDLKPELLARTRALMCATVPDCLVSDYEPLIDGLTLPDPKDRHVLAAAIKCSAQVIVTFNQRDFPAHVLSRFGLETKHPDEFVVETIDLAPAVVAGIVEAQQRVLAKPALSREELLGAFEKLGLIRSVVRLRDLR